MRLVAVGLLVLGLTLSVALLGVAADERSCVTDTHRKLWLHGLWDSLAEAAAALDKATLSDEEKARLRIAYIAALGERLSSGPPPLGARAPKPTPEDIARERRNLEAMRDRVKGGGSAHQALMEQLYPNPRERRLVELGVTLPRLFGSHYSPEAIERAARDACRGRPQPGHEWLTP